MPTKTNTRRKGRTAEQKAQEMQELHDKLAAQVEALRSSEQWTAYLKFLGSFHRYSLNNVLLVMMQYPGAQAIAGFRAWKEKGRQVRKGEKSLRIIGTGTRKYTKDEETEAAKHPNQHRYNRNADGTHTRRFFFPVSVFDIGQTDQIEGTEDVSTVAHKLTGADEQHIIGRVTDYLNTEHKADINFEPISGGRNGSTTPATEEGEPIQVLIDSTNSPAQQAKTLIHEAAHITLGHLDDAKEYAAHRGQCEVEAESVAYVVAGMCGLDTSSYSTGYVAGWAEKAEADVLKTTAANVLKAAHHLIEALENQDNEEAEQGAA